MGEGRWQEDEEVDNDQLLGSVDHLDQMVS